MTAPKRSAQAVAEDPDVALTKSMRTGTSPFVRATVLHVSLAAALLGGPWYRGVSRAQASSEAFGRFAACMLGGTVVDGGGLALPDGDRAAFARMVRVAESDWPRRCEPELAAVAQEDAVLLFPSVRQGEVTVRAAVALVREELGRVERSESAAVRIRPLDALGRLQAALTELDASASTGIDPEALAITLPADAALETASRIPLSMGEGSRTELARTAEGLDFCAHDPRRVSVVRVRGGTVHEEHERRSSSARHLVFAGGASHLLFTTSADACADEADHCVRHMTGLADTDGTAVVERTPARWLRGHLVGRSDRSAWVEPHRVGMLVASEAGTAAAIFQWSDEGPTEAPSDPPTEEPDVPRTSALDRVELGGVRDVVLTRDRVTWLGGGLYTAPLIEGRFGAVVHADVRGDRVWTCGAFVVVGRLDGVDVRRADTLGAIASLPVALRPPLEGAAPEDEPVQLACDAGTLALGLLRDRGLDVVTCDASSCVTQASDPGRAAGVSVAVHDGTVYVASWGPTGEDQVRARAIAGGIRSLGHLPPCWDDGRGFCGPARWAGSEAGLALFVRENADALVVALEDGALRGLPGLR